MIRSLLIGALSGLRSLTPVAAVSAAAARGRLTEPNGAPAVLAQPIVAGGLVLLAAGELAGDKLPSAPDRTILPGLAVRLLTGGGAAAALAPPARRVAAAALGAGAAVAAAYLGLALRRRAMARYGQVATGAIEDALTLGGSLWLVRA